MSTTKDELLLECIKQFEHIENTLGYNRFSSTQSLINEINKSLTIPAVVGQSEQLPCDHLWKSRYNEKRGSYVICAKCSKER